VPKFRYSFPPQAVEVEAETWEAGRSTACQKVGRGAEEVVNIEQKVEQWRPIDPDKWQRKKKS
jgi:hypothetical protein